MQVEGAGKGRFCARRRVRGWGKNNRMESKGFPDARRPVSGHGQRAWIRRRARTRTSCNTCTARVAVPRPPAIPEQPHLLGRIPALRFIVARRPEHRGVRCHDGDGPRLPGGIPHPAAGGPRGANRSAAALLAKATYLSGGRRGTFQQPS